MTLREAAARGITRVRLPVWASASAYLKLDLLPSGKRGPWTHLYDRLSQEAIGEPTPQSVLLDFGDDNFEAYDGPIDPEDQQV